MGGLVSPETDPTVEDAHRRGRILWALAASMAEKGYPSTTISDIARIARVSKTIVYAHFRDKEECLLELYSRATDRVLDILRTAQAEAMEQGLDWRSQIRAVIEAYFAALAGGPAVAWAALVEVQAAGPSALARRREVLERYVDLLADAAGELSIGNPDEVRAVDRRLMVAAVGGINELMLARVERADVEHLTEDAGVAADVVIGLLERRE
jgi:AcrR family transcriptional regulator